MIDPSRIDMARELIRHADGHRRSMVTFLPRYELVPDGVFYRVVVAPPTAIHPSPSGLDFNMEVRHFIDDLRSALEFCSYDAYERFGKTGTAAGGADSWRVNFPVARKNQGAADFGAVLNKEGLGNLVSARPSAVDVMRWAQHFLSPNGDWLLKLQGRWNEAKHRNLTYYSRGQPSVEVETDSAGETVYKFVGGLTFAKEGDNVERFLAVSREEVLKVVEGMGLALY